MKQRDAQFGAPVRERQSPNLRLTDATDVHERGDVGVGRGQTVQERRRLEIGLR